MPVILPEQHHAVWLGETEGVLATKAGSESRRNRVGARAGSLKRYRLLDPGSELAVAPTLVRAQRLTAIVARVPIDKVPQDKRPFRSD
jgi:hypothetical protein